MLPTNLANVIFLHGAIPVVLSQMTMTAMLVALGIVLVGGFGRLTKDRAGIRQHRYTLTVALILALVTIFLVMLPSSFNFYIDPDLQVSSPLSIITLVHGVLGMPTIATALIYALGDLPKKTAK